MPTPYGSRGGMAFSVEELRVLRRALALALHPTPASAEDVKDCLCLAESLDEAMCEGARLRAFLVADLARYRAALPGTAVGYLTLLEEALSAGYRPNTDDLAALRALRGNPAAAVLMGRCQALVERDVCGRLTPAPSSVTRATRATRATRVTKVTQGVQVHKAAPVTKATLVTPSIPASRTRLLALPGGLATADADQEPKRPEKKPAEKPAAPKPGPAPTPAPAAPKPSRRPIPTPGEVFPRRKPTPPPTDSPQQLAAG